MRPKAIKSFAGFQNEVNSSFLPYRYGDWLFRGVTKDRYKLCPSVGRFNVKQEDFQVFEKSIFDDFKKSSWNVLKRSIEDNFQLLALAQHHGLPTRLLDWSRNPYIALYFACERYPDCDGAIFALHTAGQDNLDDSVDVPNSPFRIDRNYIFNPSVTTDRIEAQEGLFTILHTPFAPLEETKAKRWELKKLLIPGNLKYEMRQGLSFQGINSARLFPGLDGMAQHISWQRAAAFSDV